MKRSQYKITSAPIESGSILLDIIDKSPKTMHFHLKISHFIISKDITSAYVPNSLKHRASYGYLYFIWNYILKFRASYSKVMYLMDHRYQVQP